MGCARQILLVLILACGAMVPYSLHPQEPRGPPPQNHARGFYLEQNYPNPVNPETWIPFVLEEGLFTEADSGLVTIRIFNILRQTVAIPVAVDHSRGRDLRVDQLAYHGPGRRVAYWDGRDMSGRLVPSGVYYYQMVVNGHPSTIRKLTVFAPRRRGNLIPWFGRN
jgi:hypothetical protein